MKKDERTKEQIVAWYQALHEAQRLRLAKTPDRTIAKKLNDQGYVTERGKPWSGNAVKRLLIQEPAKVQAQTRTPTSAITPENPMVIELRRYRDGMSGGYQMREPRVETSFETFTSEEEWLAFKAASKRGQEAYEEAIRERELRPRDWLDTSMAEAESLYTDLLMQMKYTSTPLALAGKDTWSRSIMPLVVQQVRDTGKVPMDLIDQISDPAVKGQLRRVFFGMMRLLAQEIETNMARRAKRDEPNAKARKKADLDDWTKKHMVDLGETRRESSTEDGLRKREP